MTIKHTFLDYGNRDSDNLYGYNNVVTHFFCLLQSEIFSGLTIGLFGLSRLRLEVEAELNNSFAVKLFELQRDSNLLLATLL
jgi:CBS domain containing-hemolysin-like protein